MKTINNSKLKRYTFHVPVNELWVMEVEAESEAEAWKKANTDEWNQIHTLAGTTKSGDIEIVEVKDL